MTDILNNNHLNNRKFSMEILENPDEFLDPILSVIISNISKKDLTSKCLDTLISLIRFNKNE